MLAITASIPYTLPMPPDVAFLQHVTLLALNQLSALGHVETPLREAANTLWFVLVAPHEDTSSPTWREAYLSGSGGTGRFGRAKPYYPEDWL